MLWFGKAGYSNIRTIIEKIAVILSKTLELLHFFLTLNYTRQKCKINNIWSNTLSIYHVKEWGEQAFLNVELNAGTPTAPLKTKFHQIFQFSRLMRVSGVKRSLCVEIKSLYLRFFNTRGIRQLLTSSFGNRIWLLSKHRSHAENCSWCRIEQAQSFVMPG